jgi:dTDP-4-dehydrorhamnose reductase
MTERILVTGSSGLVGSRFVELFPEKNKLVTPDLPGFDLTDPGSVRKLYADLNPQAIIHFAAFTNVNEAEKQRDDKSGPCWRVNVEGTRHLIQQMPKSCHFIYISTDMVFTGSGEDRGPYPEDHLPDKNSDKLTWYGYTKSVAESLIPESAAIVRLIYPVRAKYPPKTDYIRKPLKLFDEGKLYPLFNDQLVSLCEIDRVCELLNINIRHKMSGIFHCSSENTGTPFDIISYLLRKVRNADDAVRPSSLTQFLKTVDNPVRYPQYGGLSVAKTEKKLNIRFGTWQEIVDRLVQQGITV